MQFAMGRKTARVISASSSIFDTESRLNPLGAWDRSVMGVVMPQEGDEGVRVVPEEVRLYLKNQQLQREEQPSQVTETS